MTTRLAVAYIPLIDAAPLVVAKEMGYAREEGLELDLFRAPSWSALRDMLTFGHVEAAHMLSTLPVAMALGLGGVTSPISAPMVLSMNGNVVGVGNELAAQMRDAGHDFGFFDAKQAGQALLAVKDRQVRFGVPFPFSMHADLLHYWLSASGLPAMQGIEIKTVPPPLMAEALANGDIDAFCVGEPWGSKAVETGVGTLLLPGQAIWSFAPEKVLALRQEWTAENPELTGRLMRAVWRAARWLGMDGTHTTVSEMLARTEYLDLAPDILDRALTGHMVIDQTGTMRDGSPLVEFFAGAANFPWKSQAAWIARQLAVRLGLDPKAVAGPAEAVFRSDLYRTHLKDAGAVLPGASSKIEGGITAGTAAPSETGRLILPQNRFFDGAFFDPSSLE